MIIGLLDGQWILRRNYHAILTSGTIDYKQLISSFYSSVAKICEESDVTNPFILFDRGPYFKEEYLTLKTSRYYPKESDKIEITPEMSEEEKLKAEQANKELQEKLILEGEFRHAKSHIIKFSSKIGLPCISYKGFEADDLAYIIANEFSIPNQIRFLTVDSDWKYLMGPTTVFNRLNRAREVYEYDKMKALVPTNIPLHVYGNVITLLEGNHNDVEVLNIGHSTIEVCKFLEDPNKDWNAFIPDEKTREVFKSRLEALDPRTFLKDEVINDIREQLSTKLTRLEWNDLSTYSKDMGVRLNNRKLMNTLNKRELFNSVFEDSVIEFG